MLVTGASRGLGRAIALAAAHEGWDVALTYANDQPAARDVCATVERAGQRSIVVQADVAVEADVLSTFAALDDAWGGLDALVNNAGIGPGYGPFTSLTVDDLERTWAVNLTGAFVCAREAVRRMSTTAGGTGGSIVNVGSKASVLGGSGEWIHYAASKAGLDALTVGLSKEVAAQGIRVNAVRPGLVDGGFGPWAPEGRVEEMRSAIPMQRPGHPDEFAAAVVWLASPAASYVTGALLDVTGGR